MNANAFTVTIVASRAPRGADWARLCSFGHEAGHRERSKMCQTKPICPLFSSFVELETQCCIAVGRSCRNLIRFLDLRCSALHRRPGLEPPSEVGNSFFPRFLHLLEIEAKTLRPWLEATAS
jgi:hypothetical protein